MLTMNLIDNADSSTQYGILICENDAITETTIQNKILDIIGSYEKNNIDWFINDVIDSIPKEWKVKLQSKPTAIII